LASVSFGFNLARFANSTAIQQDFFGQSGFSGIGVRDDGKRAPTSNFMGYSVVSCSVAHLDVECLERGVRAV
jgi:hypothetical protein